MGNGINPREDTVPVGRRCTPQNAIIISSSSTVQEACGAHVIVTHPAPVQLRLDLQHSDISYSSKRQERDGWELQPIGRNCT